MTEAIEFQDLVERVEALGSGERLLLGIAGAPGSGKSTVAEKLEAALNARVAGTAAVLPMDGFHYDDMLLHALGRRQRKGAPDTFDVGGLRHVLQRLKVRDEDHVAVPVFDRDIEISRGSARLIARDIPVIIVEGNYLLLKQRPWGKLKPLFDVTVMVDVAVDVLRKRLTARWEGYKLPVDEIRRRVEENDLPNGLFVISESAAADFTLPNG